MIGFEKVCGGKQTAGVVKIGLISASAIEAITADTTDTAAIGSITLADDEVFVKYQYNEDECEFQENYSTENGVNSCEQKLIFKLGGMTPGSRNATEEISEESSCGLVAVIVRKSGTLIVGYDTDMQGERPLRLASTTGTTGKTLKDAAGEEITLSRTSTMKAQYFTGDVDALFGIE